MKKIPTMFVRDFDTGLVTPEITAGCEWTQTEGYATAKWDGVCVLFNGVKWYARRTVENANALGTAGIPYEWYGIRNGPEGFMLEEYDEKTGKAFGWVPASQSDIAPYLLEAIVFTKDMSPLPSGTYELVGPKINGNPYEVTVHGLMHHGIPTKALSDMSYEGVKQIMELFAENTDGLYVEGFVIYGLNGQRAKIKAKDFGIRIGGKSDKA